MYITVSDAHRRGRLYAHRKSREKPLVSHQDLDCRRDKQKLEIDAARPNFGILQGAYGDARSEGEIVINVTNQKNDGWPSI